MTRPLIVGAGAAGCSAALALLRGGLDPVLVDLRPERLEAFTRAAGGLDEGPRATLVAAEAFHVQPERVWLRGADGIETRPYSHLVLATGLHPVELPDRSGDWHPAGALPDARLAALIGCAFVYDGHARWIVPWTDPATRASSIGGVFVIGGARGGDGSAVEDDGRRCAAMILGRTPEDVGPAGEGVSQAWSGGMPEEIPDGLVVCPCSKTTTAEIRQAVMAGADDTHRVGRLSGAGEGECRGRRCGLAVASVLASLTGRRLREVLSPPTEFPAVPVPVSEFIEVKRERPAALPLSRDEGRLS